jgi:DNA adenine methylase
MGTVTQPIKIHGGKHYLASRIVALMPKHIHYVEPYFGGGSVLLAKDPEGVSEVVNDIDGDLMTFWRVLQAADTFRDFARIVEAMPFSQAEFDQSLKDRVFGSEVDRAVSFFVRCRQSLAGRMKDFAPLSRTRTRRGMNEQASAWLTAVEGLPAVHERLKRVVILNRDALDVIRQQDGEATLFYLDSPYLDQTRSSPDVYAHEMTPEQHADLLKLINGDSMKSYFMLSGYRSPMYDEALRHWRRHDFSLPNSAAGGKTKRIMTESIWCNF